MFVDEVFETMLLEFILKFVYYLIGLYNCSNDTDDARCPLIYPGEEKYFKSVKQLTFSGKNAEAYFSFDDRQITFQAADYRYQCDQIFRFPFDHGDMSKAKPLLISTGFGQTTCSYFLPDDKHILYASTHLGGPQCPVSSCSKEVTSKNKTLRDLCNKVKYVWNIFPTYDIFLATKNGILVKRLTDEYGYDAEGTVQPGGDLIVYTSISSGDLELWTMKLDGTNKKQITNVLGYDGGAFFSPDGRKLVFRGSRPETKSEISLYKELLSYNMVSPLKMEIYIVNVDGSNMKRITNLGGSNWAPYYYPSGKKIIFSSNYLNPLSFNFQLFSINENGTGLEQVTNGSTFNSFPMFSFDGKRLIFSSTRNSSLNEINLFLAEFKNNSNFAVNIVWLMLVLLLLTKLLN